jgi:flagellar biosynthetic protein FliS
MDRDTQQRLQREYVESRILSAHPVELVAMLFAVATENLRNAIEYLKSGERIARSRAVTRAEQAIHELLISLDYSVNPPFAQRTAALYRYAVGRIIAGHAEESQEAFEEALAVLEPVAAAWSDVKTRMCAEPAGEGADQDESRMPDAVVNDPYAAYRGSPAVATSRDWSI